MARKLSERQHRVLDARRNQVLNTPDAGEWALLIANLGRQVQIELESGALLSCFVRQNLGALVAGDRVLVSLEDPHNPVIIARADRTSLLFRPDPYHRQKDIAANITQLVIVTAKLPEFIPYYLDQYLVIAEYFHLSPLILFNKTDLLDKNLNQDLKILETLKYYHEQLGYPWLACSALEHQGLEAFNQALIGHQSVMMGLSGTGKSSLINALFRKPLARTQEVSQANLKGQHTTTTAQLYHLPQGGNLIDSPGIREFGVWDLERQAIFQGFKEFHADLGHCQFRDCRHDKEPGCRIQLRLSDPNALPSARRDSLFRMLESAR